jgi:hypothetical protein
MKKKLHWLRLLKQVEHGLDDYREYDVPKVRKKSYEDLLMHLGCYDYPHTDYVKNRSWKRHRKTQYKQKGE